MKWLVMIYPKYWAICVGISCTQFLTVGEKFCVLMLKSHIELLVDNILFLSLLFSKWLHIGIIMFFIYNNFHWDLNKSLLDQVFMRRG